MAGYHILINEEQRLALLELLVKKTDPMESFDESNALRYWRTMLSELPVVEKENPGTIHGFCL